MTVSRIMILLLAAATSFHTPARADHLADEYEVKAGFLFNFARYVTWPTGAFDGEETPFVIGIFGRDHFGTSLLPFANKTLKNRNVVFRRFSTPEEAALCHILFIGDSERPPGEVLRSLGKSGILTVSDLERFTEAGGMIQLLTVDHQVRFAINLKATEEAGLRMSSKMLKLATSVGNE